MTVLDASAKATEAQIEALRVNLGYTKIRAPIGGRTGAITYTKGNNVRTAETQPMVVINQIAPITVSLALPQTALPRLKESMAAGGVQVIAEVPNSNRKVEGKVVFIDNLINTATGTFQIKADFDNQDTALWPGMYVNSVVRLGVETEALSVPVAAIQAGQQGSFVYVVKPAPEGDGRVVETRLVTVDRQTATEAIIGKGLSAGEIVVTDGHLRLGPGSRVDIRQPAPVGGTEGSGVQGQGNQGQGNQGQRRGQFPGQAPSQPSGS